MFIPQYKISQDEEHIYITIHAPSTDLKDASIQVDEENFLFVSRPYFLRLRLAGKIVKNDAFKARFKAESGYYHLMIKKKTPGEEFDLEKTVNVRASRTGYTDALMFHPNVEILTHAYRFAPPGNRNRDIPYPYGFGSKFTKEKIDITEFGKIIDLQDPDSVAMQDRHILRKDHEDGNFSCDYYLANYLNVQKIGPFVDLIMFWNQPDFEVPMFTAPEVYCLLELPVKAYILDWTQENHILLGLVDILFAYCYAKRTEVTHSFVDPSKVINKLSSTLSWFCNFDNVREVLIACYRRALVYPNYRHYDICIKVQEDLAALLQLGKMFIIKCLIEVHQMFEMSSDRFILNQLYITDYIIFLLQGSNKRLELLCKGVADTRVTKLDLEFDLEEQELAIKMADLEMDEYWENRRDRNENGDLEENDDDGDDEYEDESDEAYHEEFEGDTTDESGDESQDYSSDDEDYNSDNSEETEARLRPILGIEIIKFIQRKLKSKSRYYRH